MEKKIQIWLVISIFLIGCQNEDSAPRGVGSTFMKFIGTDANNTAVTAIEGNGDGSFLLLVNASQNITDDPKEWIKLIKTDAGGNVLWTESYKREQQEGENIKYRSSSIISLPEGYLIIGESINNGSSSVYLLKVDSRGTPLQEMTLTPQLVSEFQGKTEQAYSLSGKAAVFNNNELFILAEKNYSGNTSTNYAFFAQVDMNDLSLVKVNDKIGAGRSTFTHDLYFNKGQELLFGGHFTDVSGTNKIRIIPATFEDISSPGTIEPSITSTNRHSFINQFTYYPSGALLAIGETSADQIFEEEAESDRVLVIVNKNGVSENTEAFQVEINDPATSGSEAATGYVGLINEQGNIVIAGAVGNEEGERKLFLQKIDPLKNTLWDAVIGEGKGRIYGGNGEIPAAIINTTDGGYFVLSTTHFGNIASLLLLKTDANGKL